MEKPRQYADDKPMPKTSQFLTWTCWIGRIPQDRDRSGGKRNGRAETDDGMIMEAYDEDQYEMWDARHSRAIKKSMSRLEQGIS